jgi:hypothetical protein
VSDTVTREEVLAFRVRAQQLDRESGTIADTQLLDLGVQDTGPDGARWALALRGLDLTASDEVAMAWTTRGAPHLYRRQDLPSVAHAVQPFSDADAGKRIYDAAKPLRAAVGILDALDTVGARMREVAAEPTVKGVVSRRISDVLPEPYLRFCRACNAVHTFEMPFRLAALRAGLELEPATSPPVLRRAPGLDPITGVAGGYDERHDVIRTYLRFLGPATPKQVADYLDAPVREIKARWPEDAVTVSVAGEDRSVLREDLDALRVGRVTGTRLLGPYDAFLQAKDRPLLVADPARAKSLWPVLGRPGAVLHHGELVGTWRARKTGTTVNVEIQVWQDASDLADAVGEQAERLAGFRELRLGALDLVR